MIDYKKQFINFLLEKRALLIGGPFTLKSGRKSPYFINTGMFYDGESIGKLGHFYAAKIVDRFKPEEFDIIFGPAYKGIPLCVATAIALDRDFGIKKKYAFNRKEAKGHGEATKEDKQKNWIVGKIEDGSKILMVDDVFTTGETKYQSIDLLNSVADNLQYPGLIIAVDRQEVSTDGRNAIKEFEERTGIIVDSIVNITEIIKYLWEEGKIEEQDKENIEDYLRKYGTEDVKNKL